MNITPYSLLYERFYFRILNDDKFFNYTNVTPEESMKLAQERANSYLEEAIKELMLNCTSQVDFYDRDNKLEQFNFKLTGIEIELIVDLMFESYIKEDVAKLKVGEIIYGTKDLSVFSPANDRKTFMEMYNSLRVDNRKNIERYASRDRLTNREFKLSYDY